VLRGDRMTDKGRLNFSEHEWEPLSMGISQILAQLCRFVSDPSRRKLEGVTEGFLSIEGKVGRDGWISLDASGGTLIVVM